MALTRSSILLKVEEVRKERRRETDLSSALRAV